MIVKINLRKHKILLISLSSFIGLIIFLEICEQKNSFFKSWLYDKNATNNLIIATVSITSDINPEITRTKIIEKIDAIKKAQPEVDFIVFGEVITGCYFSDVPDYHKSIAETLPGTISDLLSKQAKDKNIFISFGMVEQQNDKIYNSQVLIDNFGKIINVQRKKNLGTNYYNSGQESISFVDIKGVKMGIVICLDIQFPETRKKALGQKTDLVILSLADNLDKWDKNYFAYRYLAKLYNSWIITANRYGKDCNHEWDGHIEVVNSFGDILSSSRFKESYIVYEVKINREQSKSKIFIRKLYSRISLGYLVIKNLRTALAYLQ